MSIIEDIKLLQSKTTSNEANSATFEMEPFFPGYGITIGHALRRVLLTSLHGSAITAVKIDGVTHEFSTIKGAKEDVIEIILNLKHLIVKSHSKEPVTLKLNKKGPGKVTSADFTKNAQVEIIDKDQYIATLDKNSKLDMEVTIEQGYGYVPVEKRETKLALGNIAIDAIYNPVKKINYSVENTRVGGKTDYDKLILNITTTGTISPEEALKQSIDILMSYFENALPASAKKITKEIAKPKKKKAKKESSKKDKEIK